jgi:septal ring factor EnvC (AmiA/AmiB activator)
LVSSASSPSRPRSSSLARTAGRELLPGEDGGSHFFCCKKLKDLRAECDELRGGLAAERSELEQRYKHMIRRDRGAQKTVAQLTRDLEASRRSCQELSHSRKRSAEQHTVVAGQANDARRQAEAATNARADAMTELWDVRYQLQQVRNGKGRGRGGVRRRLLWMRWGERFARDRGG